MLRAPLLAIAAGAALALAACGDDDEKGGTTTVIERTVTQTVPAGTTTTPTSRPVRQRCGDVVFKENSGNAAFDVVADGITCDHAERLLRSDSGLERWNCEAMTTTDATGGGDRVQCASKGRRIEYTGGN